MLASEFFVSLSTLEYLFPETIKLQICKRFLCTKELMQNISWSQVSHYGWERVQHCSLIANGHRQVNQDFPWPVQATIKWYSQLKPTRAKLQSQNLYWGSGQSTAKPSQLSRKLFNCLTWLTAQSPNNKKQNDLARVGLSWPRWPNGGKHGSSLA